MRLTTQLVALARGMEELYQTREPSQRLAEGRSNAEVAILFEMGLLAVEAYRANLMQKPNLLDTAEPVPCAIRKGLVA